MKKPSIAQIEAFNADFVKIFTSGLSVGIVIFGYSYSHTFFRSFGISLFQLDMDWIDILFRGIALIQDLSVALSLLALIIFGSMLFSIRNFVGPSMQIIVIAISVMGVLLSATWGGQALGYSHARSIWADGKGKLAFCTINTSKHPSYNSLSASLNEQALNQRLRLILKTKDHIYIAPVVEKIKPNQTTGEAYVIPTNVVSYCRIVGS